MANDIAHEALPGFDDDAERLFNQIQELTVGVDVRVALAVLIDTIAGAIAQTVADEAAMGRVLDVVTRDIRNSAVAYRATPDGQVGNA